MRRPHAPLAFTLAALGALAAGAAWAQAPEPGSQLFQITLVAATPQAGEAPGGFPPAIAKALDDLRDFLPHRGYRLVDSALVRGSGEAHARLTGPNGTPYEASLLFRPLPRDAGTASYLVERFSLHRPRAAPEPLPAGRLPMPPAAHEEELQVTFRIARGETVVVGSSRLESGDGALIVLLTAVP